MVFGNEITKMIHNQQQLIDYVKSKLKAGVRDKSSEAWLASNNIKTKSVTQLTKDYSRCRLSVN